MRLGSALLVSFVSSTAFAQEPPPPPPPTATSYDAPAPSTGSAFLPNLLSTAAGTTVELELDYVDVDNVDATVLGMMGHLQYVTPQGMGVYLRVPFAYIDVDGGDSVSALGNVEIGGLFVNKQSPTTDVYLRAGVSIDTVDEGDDIFALAFSHLIPRLNDGFTAAGFDSTWGRAQVGIVSSSGVLRFGGMAGADIPIEGAVRDSGLDVLLHFAGSVGIEQGDISGGVGLALVQPISDGDDENATNLNIAIAFAVNPQMKLFGTLAANVDGFDGGFDGTSFGIGIRAGM